MLVGTLGWAYWMWMAIHLGSFGMFIFCILGPFAMVAGARTLVLHFEILHYRASLSEKRRERTLIYVKMTAVVASSFGA